MCQWWQQWFNIQLLKPPFPLSLWGTLLNIIFPFTILIYFQMKCSVTVSSQANNAPELVQYSCKLRDAEEDKTFCTTHKLCVHSCFNQTICTNWVQIHPFPLLLWVNSMSLIISCNTPDVLQWSPDELFSDPGVPFDVSTSTRGQVTEVSRSGNCSTPVS